MPSPEIPPPIRFLGVSIHPLRSADLLQLLVAFGRGSALRRAHYVNVHGMNLARSDPAFRAILNAADVVFCDGYGVKWGARLAGLRLPERMTPPDWIEAFAAASASAGQPVFALGDVDGVAASFQAALRAQHPAYLDAGSAHGFFAQNGPENDRLVDRINASGAVHLLVGMGMPLQEKWIDSNFDRLRVRTAISVGALFRWVTGHDRRAPKWMTDNGLEWLARFAGSPVRHFRRYAVGIPGFLIQVLRERLSDRRSG